MGSLDVSSAKLQFFQLVDAISASHLPSFTIWLDAKLAEYKTIGQLKPDTEFETKEQYPEWIAKALRQNLSFIFPGPANTKSVSDSDPEGSANKGIRKRKSSQNVGMGSEVKRSKMPPPGGSSRSENEPAEDDLVIVKEELASPLRDRTADELARATETPLPGIQSTFSLSYETANQFVTPSKDTVITTAESTTSVTSSQEVRRLSSSLPRPAFTGDANMEQFATTFSFDTAASPHDKSSLSFSPSLAGRKLEDTSHHSPQLVQSTSTSEPPVGAAAYPISTDVSFAKGDVEYSEAAVQDVISRLHGGKSTYALTSDDIRLLKNANGEISCALCGKSCDTFQNYKKHFVSHSKENPFKCPYCPRRFSDVCNCYRHVRNAHRDMPHVKVLPDGQ